MFSLLSELNAKVYRKKFWKHAMKLFDYQWMDLFHRTIFKLQSVFLPSKR